MSTYASLDDMISRFGERQMVEATAHLDPESTEIAESVVADALADADAEINSYLGGRYAVPLAEVPRILLPLACDIARYRLWQDRASETIIDRYKAAISFLRDVAAGKATLGIADPQTEPAETSGGVQLSTGCASSARDSLRGW